MFVSLAVAIVVATWVVSRHLSASRQARAALTTGKEYRGLADGYRRLSDMAITAQEHTELKLTEVSVQVGELQAKLDRMEHILREVE